MASPTDDAAAPQPDDATATTAMLKAMSHPLRRAALRALQSRGSARASDLAADLDVAPNTMSFHLRSLAAGGLIVEDPSRAADRRERVWVPAEVSVNIREPGRPVADEALTATVLRELFADHAERARRLAAWSLASVGSADPEPHGVFSSIDLRLTSAEAVALHRRLLAVVDEARTAHDPDTGESRMYDFDILAVDDTI
ncbi:ArsR/SmtB family transcription factor [Microbacterium karelineae]|uniref:ArsR/SmtB family transcription factor n=1 Tax=Microbacterium karelineae TaxID=2654283 RepID=UPI0012E9E58E|nr:helix-turn-helix domain-containing protein [Microbacterium karelineae]